MFKNIIVSLVLSLLASTVFAEKVSTRFGSLEVNDGNVLLFNNQVLNPEIQGNNSISIKLLTVMLCLFKIMGEQVAQLYITCLIYHLQELSLPLNLAAVQTLFLLKK